MTVPKGVTVSGLTTETMEKGGNTFNQYYYNGQFVGYAQASSVTPTAAGSQADPAASESGENTAAVQTAQGEENGQAVQDNTSQETGETVADEEESEGLSHTAKYLLIAMGAMGVLLIALLIALYIKNG